MNELYACVCLMLYGDISNLPLQNASGTKMKMKQAVSSYLINVK